MKKARKMKTRLVLILLRRVKYLTVLCGVAFMLLSSCTAQTTYRPPITISLAPQVSGPKIDLGGGRKVYLSVVDERPTNFLLDFHNLNSGVAPIVSTMEPIDVVLNRSIGNGLTSMGFELIPASSNSEAWLKLNISAFEVNDHTARLDFWGRWTGVMTVKALVVKGDTPSLQKEYTSAKDFVEWARASGQGVGSLQKEYTSAKDFVFGYFSLESLFTANINPLVSDLILRILGDLELIAALQSPED